MKRSTVWIYLGFFGFLGYMEPFPDWLRLLHLAWLVPPLLRLAARRRGSERAEEGDAPPVILPLPPAAGGALRFTLRLYTATLLMLIVPRMLRQIIRQTIGNSRAAPRTPQRAGDYQQKTRYRLPFDGEWMVYNGGITPGTSHSWDIAAQRYAYDCVVTDAQRQRWRTDGRQVTDYYCYDLPILAPADGEVVAVVDGVRDAPGVGTGWLDAFTAHFPGNVIVIRHAEGEYSFLAHLIPGSLRVQVGDRVTAGQTIGRCGHSGHSTEPHLHFHIQDRADFWEAAGLPVAFDRVSVNGGPPQNNCYLLRGQRVAHQPG